MSAAEEQIVTDLGKIGEERHELAKRDKELIQRALELTPGEIIAELDQIREERKRISQRDKELVEVWRVLEAKLIEIGDKMGMKRMTSDSHTATITQETLPVVEDFDELWEYMKANDAPHLLQRRVSAGAYRELQDAGVDIPGLTPYVQRKISLRKI